MIPTIHPVRLGLAVLIASAAAAQDGEPPWWFVSDNDTVSAQWEFTTQPNLLLPIPPASELGPSWYQGSTIQLPPGFTWQGQLTNHTGVIVYSNQASAQVTAAIGNDPRPNWIKLFWMQFDAFETAPRSIESEIASDPSYTRHNVKVDVAPLGQGWSRVTVEGTLRPQPSGEDFFWEFAAGTGALALDNIYVNTRCYPLDNELPESDALGEPTGYVVDVAALTGNTEAEGCTQTDIPGQGERFWVSARSRTPTAPHELFAFDAATGALVFTGTQNVRPANSPSGLRDLTTVRVGTVVRIFGGFANPQGLPEFHAFDPVTLTWDTARNFVVATLPGTEPFGLAFNPDGLRGAGTLWFNDQFGNIHEVDLQGNVVSTGSAGAVIRGAGYDRFRGELYWFGRTGSTDPRNPEALGVIYDVRNLQPTGARFYGSFAANSATSPNGRALGLEVYRTRTQRQTRIVALADNGSTDLLYVLSGTYRYGLSCLGDVSMNFRAPFLGVTPNLWQARLTGAPPGSGAILYLGFSKTNIPGGPTLPLSLNNFGFRECAIVQSLDLQMGTTIVNANGVASIPVALPNLPGLSQTPTYWQWVVFGNNVPGILATSPGAKTLLY